jgi:hypothetical protein
MSSQGYAYWDRITRDKEMEIEDPKSAEEKSNRAWRFDQYFRNVMGGNARMCDRSSMPSNRYWR